MSHQPEQLLFRSSHPQVRIFRLSIVLIALLANTSLTSVTGIALVTVLGWVLLFVHYKLGHKFHGIPKSVLLLSVVMLAFATTISTGNKQVLAMLTLKLLSGVAWMALLSSIVSWKELKLLFDSRASLRDFFTIIDSSLSHGLILINEFKRRRNCAYLRLFRKGKKRLGVEELSWSLAGGIDQAFARITRAEESRTQRLLSVTLKPSLSSSGDEKSFALNFKNVFVGTNDEFRLKNCSFSLSQGEWIAIAGASGAGKTTLLNVASGLTSISAGKFDQLRRTLSGTERFHERAHSDIGLVCQEPYEQILGSTPLDDISLGLLARGVTRSDAEVRALDIMAELNISHLADRPVSLLSYGERKRVAIAAILVCNPQVLLCDEPTGGLDPVSALNLISALERIARQNPSMSVLWATHDWHTLPKQIQRALLLKNGEIVFDGYSLDAFGNSQLVKAGLAEDLSETRLSTKKVKTYV